MMRKTRFLLPIAVLSLGMMALSALKLTHAPTYQSAWLFGISAAELLLGVALWVPRVRRVTLIGIGVFGLFGMIFALIEGPMSPCRCGGRFALSYRARILCLSLLIAAPLLSSAVERRGSILND